MKIVSLQSENFMRLVAISISPNGRVVKLTGRNAQGKSSAIKAISVAIEGMEDSPAVAIRKGETQARIRLDLGELIVTRTYRKDGDSEEVSSVIVERADGSRFPSPQKMLDSLRGQRAIDPLAFLRLKEREQFDEIRVLVPDFDFDANERTRKEIFDRRTDVNRFAKEARASASLIVVPGDTPAEPVDESALVDALQRANEHNNAIERRKENRERATEKVKSLQVEASRLQQQADSLRRQADELLAQAREASKEADELGEKLSTAESLPDPIDVTAVRSQIDHARAVNANVAKLETRSKHEQLAAKYSKEADDLTAQIADLHQQKQSAIAKAHMPMEGLSLGDGVVLLNDLPLAQASMSEKFRAAIAIRMAMKPELRVIWVQDASLLDDVSLQIVTEMAEKHDYQVWLEVVDTSGRVGFTFEEGRVVAVDGDKVEQPPPLELTGSPAQTKKSRKWQGPGAPKESTDAGC